MGEGGKGQGELSDLNQVVYCVQQAHNKLYTYIDSGFKLHSNFPCSIQNSLELSPSLHISYFTTVVVCVP